VAQRRTYRPFGEKVDDSAAFAESLGYIGQRTDDDTGLTYLRARTTIQSGLVRITGHTGSDVGAHEEMKESEQPR